jgi:hypothetical protein
VPLLIALATTAAIASALLLYQFCTRSLTSGDAATDAEQPAPRADELPRAA